MVFRSIVRCPEMTLMTGMLQDELGAMPKGGRRATIPTSSSSSPLSITCPAMRTGFANWRPASRGITIGSPITLRMRGISTTRKISEEEARSVRSLERLFRPPYAAQPRCSRLSATRTWPRNSAFIRKKIASISSSASSPRPRADAAIELNTAACAKTARVPSWRSILEMACADAHHSPPMPTPRRSR